LDGRFSISGVNEGNVDYLAESIDHVLRQWSHYLLYIRVYLELYWFIEDELNVFINYLSCML
jgi:hypothetical protein